MLRSAIKYMLISTFAFAFLNAIVKYLSDFNVSQIIYFRALGSFGFCMIYLKRNKIPVLGNNKQLLLLRALMGLIAMTLFFLSLKYLSMGSATSIRYISPIFAALFAVLLLKEKIWPIQWLFFAMAFLGVLLLKGFDAQMNTIGLLAALFSAIFTGLVFVILRKIGKRDHPVVVVNYFMGVSAFVSMFFMLFHWKQPTYIEWLLFLSLGVFGYYGQLYMTKAFQAVETNKIAPIKYVEVIFTLIIGMFWFGEVYTLLSVFAIVLILLGLILNVFYKQNIKKAK